MVMNLSPDVALPSGSSDTIEVKLTRPHNQSEAEQPTLLSHVPQGLTVAKGTHIGQVRERNEDSYLTVDSIFHSGDSGATLGLFIIADGMGGHQDGDIASSLATRVTAGHLAQDTFALYLSSQERSSRQRPINEILIEAIQTANEAVHQQVPQAGTTITVALVLGHKVYLAHVGDCRAYLFDEGRLHQITRDHSVIARLVESGRTTPEEALTHGHRGVLYRAVGQTDSVEVDTYMYHFPVGSCLLLCSDGLWDQVPDAEMSEILKTAPNLQAAVDRLLAAANDHGGDDNITVIIVSRGT
jgi:serine/threonine protein phosphatase PrpC